MWYNEIAYRVKRLSYLVLPKDLYEKYFQDKTKFYIDQLYNQLEFYRISFPFEPVIQSLDLTTRYEKLKQSNYITCYLEQ